MRKCMQEIIVFLMMCCLSGCASFKHDMYDFMITQMLAKAKLKPGTVQIPGQALAYLERTGAGETILLIHGFGANKELWSQFIQKIPTDYRVIALDLPGHGDNIKNLDRTYTTEFMTTSVSQAVEALKLERFHIAGFSMGGYIAADYASRNPQKVITLCLMDNTGFHSISPQPSDLQVALEKGRNPLIPTSKAEFSEFVTYCFYKKPFLPWPIESVMEETIIEASDFRKKMFDELELFSKKDDLRSLLPRLDMPVLVIWGDHDRILHVSATEIIKPFLPNAEIVILKDCGHMPIIEKSQETAEYYTDFLNRQKGEEQSWSPAWLSAH